jgi:hypothetical protein
MDRRRLVGFAVGRQVDLPLAWALCTNSSGPVHDPPTVCTRLYELPRLALLAGCEREQPRGLAE